MSREDDLMARISNAIVGHDAQGRAILALSEDAPPIVMDIPGMTISGYGLGAPMEGCQCPYCGSDKSRLSTLPTFSQPT